MTEYIHFFFVFLGGGWGEEKAVYGIIANNGEKKEMINDNLAYTTLACPTTTLIATTHCLWGNPNLTQLLQDVKS